MLPSSNFHKRGSVSALDSDAEGWVAEAEAFFTVSFLVALLIIVTALTFSTAAQVLFIAIKSFCLPFRVICSCS